MPSPPLLPGLEDFNAFLAETLALANDNSERADLETAAHRIHDFSASVLVAGLRSVGKSSFVCALWGDAELLPTAERDCTQTNTRIRKPRPGESDQHIFLEYLQRGNAVDFATRGLAYHHLADALSDALGPEGPRLDEMLPEARLRAATAAVRKLFAENPKLAVLQENLTDDLNEIEQFLRFIDSPEYRDGGVVEEKWANRRDHLMGKRHPDGRTVDVGPLLALRHVELVRTTTLWPEPAPQLIDTPWVPAFHNARRMDLILAQARQADVLMILTRPESFEPEEWVLQILKERPELAARTLLVFNQADTADVTQLFGRDGFLAAYESAAKKMAKLGIEAKNLYISCARFPFLEQSLTASGATAAALTERIAKLRTVLERIRKMSDSRPESPFKTKLLAACNGTDCGTEPVRVRLQELAFGPVYRARIADALTVIERAAIKADNPGPWHAALEKARNYRTHVKGRPLFSL